MNHPKCVIDQWKLFDSLDYEPHEGQRAFHECAAKNRVAPCGWGWGKSKMLAYDALPLILSPQTTTWIVGPDYGEASREYSIIYEGMYTLGLLADCPVKTFNVDQGSMKIKTPDSCGGSTVTVKTERNPHSLEAEDVDNMLYAEAGQMKRTTYQRCQGRLRTGGYQTAAFTPEGFNWTHDDLWLLATDPEEHDWWGRRGPSWENPHLDPAWLEAMKVRLSPSLYEAKIEGKFRTHTGFVFPDFDPNVHMAALGGIVRGRPLYGAVDYGYTNPTVVLDIQVNEFDQVLVLGEYYRTQTTSVEHASTIKEWGKRYELMLDDPAGADAHKIWKDNGLPVFPMMCEVETGNELINELLKIREDGLPGIMFDVSCVNCRREMTKYRWGPTRDDLNSKEAPVKADDHIPEALKRFVAWRVGARRMKDVQPAHGGARAFDRKRMPRGAM